MDVENAPQPKPSRHRRITQAVRLLRCALVVDKADRLGVDSPKWALADNDGLTVAHMAAVRNRLPAGFDRWELADNDGWTVAHLAAALGHLPPDFDRWDLADKRGQTVREVAERRLHILRAHVSETPLSERA